MLLIKMYLRNLGILNKVKHKLSQLSLLLLYNALIQPHLSYCNIVWGSTYESNLDKLLKLQKRALRIVCGSPFRASSNPLFVKLNKLKLCDITKQQIAMFMYKVMCRDLPDNLLNYFVLNLQVHHHNTRNSALFHIDCSRTNLRKFSINCTGPKLWNSIPVYIQNAKSLYIFKKSYVAYLVNSYSL